MKKGKAILVKDLTPKSKDDFIRVVKNVPRFDYLFSRFGGLNIDHMELKVYKLNPKLFVDNVIKECEYVLIATIFISKQSEKRYKYEYKESSAYKSNKNGKILNSDEIYITHRNKDHEDVLNDMGREWYELIKLKPKTSEHFGDILTSL